MNSIHSVIAKILGTLFYYSPESEQALTLQPLLNELSDLYDWQNKTIIDQHIAQLAVLETEDLAYQYSVLFEGQGEMPAPPWGSVYLDKENLLMGESTIDYRQFLAQQKLITDTGMNEPEDQFGLMLLAMAWLMDNQQPQAVAQLLQKHLLPWAPRYLQLVIERGNSPYYGLLAAIASEYLNQLQQELCLTADNLKLYK